MNSKVKASKTFNAMGLSLSEAVRVFLTRSAADQAFPFQLEVPNAETIAAMQAAERKDGVKFNGIDDLMADLHAED